MSLPIINFRTFQKSVNKEKEVTSELATELLGSMQTLSAYQDDPTIKYYKADMNATGKFLFHWVYQIESEVHIKPPHVSTELSSLNSCMLIAADMERIQKNLEKIIQAQSEAQTRLDDADVLVQNFLKNVKNDTNLQEFLDLDLSLSAYDILLEVIESIKEHFIFETPRIIAHFAEAFAKIYVSLKKTSQKYDEYFQINLDNSQLYMNVYKRNC